MAVHLGVHVAGQPDGQSKIETTKSIYGRLFAQDRVSIVTAINGGVSRLHTHEGTDEDVEWPRLVPERRDAEAMTTRYAERLRDLGRCPCEAASSAGHHVGS